MHTHPLDDYVKCLDRSGWDGVGELMLSLIIDDTSSPLPTLDSTRLLALAALQRALQRQQT